MDTINYMAIYLDDSCEVHFSNENSKLILSPCGSEFMYSTYNDSMTSSMLYILKKIRNYILDC
jgi:hypothetical protein